MQTHVLNKNGKSTIGESTKRRFMIYVVQLFLFKFLKRVMWHFSKQCFKYNLISFMAYIFVLK